MVWSATSSVVKWCDVRIADFTTHKKKDVTIRI